MIWLAIYLAILYWLLTLPKRLLVAMCINAVNYPNRKRDVRIIIFGVDQWPA